MKQILPPVREIDVWTAPNTGIGYQRLQETKKARYFQTFQMEDFALLPQDPFTQEAVLTLLMRDDKCLFNSLCGLLFCCKQCT